MSFITLDYETAYRSANNVGTPGLKYSLKSMTYEEYILDRRFKIHGVGVKIDQKPTEYVKGHKEAVEVTQELFHKGNKNTLLAHNAMFDAAIISWKLGLHVSRALCTQQMSRAMWFQSKHGLADLAKRLFPDDLSKRKGKELVTVDGLWDLTDGQQKKLGGYCIKDVDLAFDSFAAMYPYFPDEEFEVLAETLDWFINPSFVVDRPRVARYERDLLAKQQAKIDTAFESHRITKTTLSSNKKFHEWLQAKGVNVPIIPSPTKKNPNNTKPALGKGDVEFLDMMEAHKELTPVWEARMAVTSKGELTRCARILKHSEHQKEHRIAVPLNYCGAGTTRWSGTNKCNFQNFKRGSEIRKSLKAPKGERVVVCDLSNIEGRMNAWNAGQEWKVMAFANGEDLYNVMASAIYKRPIDRDKPEDKLEGFIGKVAELGLGYGMGGPTFQNTLKKGALGGPRVFFELSQCYDVVNTYREKNFAIVAYWKLCEQFIIDMCNKNLEPYYHGPIQIQYQRIKLPNGLYLNYPGLECIEDAETGRYAFQYWNGKFMKNLYGALLTENIIQALSRITMSEMIIDIRDWVKPRGGRVVSSVHDEIILLTPNRIAETAYEKLASIMSTAPEWAPGLPLAAKGDIAATYGDCK